MYAVFQNGGRQYRVSAGDELVLDKQPADPGQTLEFDQVLLCSQEDGTRVGAPYLDGAKVVAEVLDHELGPKVIIGKARRRKRYRRKTGFRAQGTRVQIKEITL